MKCSTKFLTLFAVSSAFAYTIPMEKREDNYDYSYLGTNPIFPLKKECTAAIEKYQGFEECNIKLDDTHVDIENACKVFNTEKCQEIYKIRISEIPECKSSEEVSLVSIDTLLRTTYVSLKAVCTMDENNNICPLHKLESQYADQDITDKESVEIFNKALNDTCKSKICTNAFIEYEEEMKKVQSSYMDMIKKYDTDGEIVKVIQDAANKVKRQFTESDIDLGLDGTLSKTIEFLKSEECTSQASGASKTKQQTEQQTEQQTKQTEQIKETKQTGKKTRKCIVKN